jgi:hypothetical protein
VVFGVTFWEYQQRTGVIVEMGDMTEDVTRMWEKFNLLEVESVGIKTQEVDFEPLVVRGSTCVVGKLLADRVVGKEIIKTPLIRAWKPTERVSFKTVGENTFLIEFANEWDKARIMEGRPWTFDGDLVSLVEFDGLTPLAELEFEKAAFWVRMFNLPLACMSKDMGMRIGSTMGDVEEVEVDEDGMGWGEYLRVRIVLDLTKPLSKGRFLHIHDKEVWIDFKYERIPRFCFKCGTVRHGGRECIAPERRKALRNGGEAQFGPWLRVTSGGYRTSGAGRGRNLGAWRNTAHPSHVSVTSNRLENHGGSAGSSATETGGVGKGTTDSRQRPKKGKISETGKQQQFFKDSEFFRDPLNQEREDTFLEDFNAELEEQSPKINEAVGETQSGVNNIGGAAQVSINEHISNGKGKSIYVGQWDAIKEKMVWATLEKENEVARSGESRWDADLMEGSRLAPVCKFQGHGSTEKARTRLPREDKIVMAPSGSISAGWKRSNREVPVDTSGETEIQKLGKRKAQGVQATFGKQEGKRYKLMDEKDEGSSADEAVAAEQPRHTQ